MEVRVFSWAPAAVFPAFGTVSGVLIWGVAGKVERMDYQKARKTMILSQLRPMGIVSRDVIEAFETIPREVFVPEAQRALSYCDGHLPIDEQKFLLSPTLLGFMVQSALLKASDSALVLGDASGYLAAIVSRLAGSVLMVEPDAQYVHEAERRLASLACDNAVVIAGPLEQGLPGEAPFEAIFIAGSVEDLPDALTSQLAESGRLIAVYSVSGRRSVLAVWMRQHGSVSMRHLLDMHAPALKVFSARPSFVF